MEIIGYIAALLVGISLGLIGGGGSILTLPVLVYLFTVPPPLAVSYSLFIVGISSLVGAYDNYRKHQVHIKTALVFGASSITTVLLVRSFIIPRIPEVIMHAGDFQLRYDVLVMVVFAALMVAASVSMIRKPKNNPLHHVHSGPWRMISYGVLIGLVTGFLGAGGGFLLIPALVVLMRLPMKVAIGTSLLIIALNSLIGFAADVVHHTIDWKFIGSISLIAIAGIFIGGYFNQKVKPAQLKKGFGWFVLAMGIYIIASELFMN